MPIFKTWDFASFQEEINPLHDSIFNLDTLLSESLLSQMFADDYPGGPDGSAHGFFNGSSTSSSNQDAFRGPSSSIHNQQEQLNQSHLSWNKPRTNPSPKPPRKTHLSFFGESSDEEDGGAPAAAVKPNAPTPAPTTSAWPSTKDGTTPVSRLGAARRPRHPLPSLVKVQVSYRTLVLPLLWMISNLNRLRLPS